MKNSILIIDNFLDNPNEVRKLSLKYPYHTPSPEDGWKGYRTTKWIESINPYRDISKKIKQEVCKHFKLDVKKVTAEYFFHYCLQNTKDTCSPSFEEYKFHKDPNLLSGVIYLTPDPPNNCGTEFVDTKVENVYNRLTCYPGNLLHGPENLFGDNILNARFTITFFIYDINNAYCNYW